MSTLLNVHLDDDTQAILEYAARHTGCTAVQLAEIAAAEAALDYARGKGISYDPKTGQVK